MVKDNIQVLGDLTLANLPWTAPSQLAVSACLDQQSTNSEKGIDEGLPRSIQMRRECKTCEAPQDMHVISISEMQGKIMNEQN